MTAVIDTSVLVAIVVGEPDAEALVRVVAGHAGDLHLSTASLVETKIVIEAKQGSAGTADLRLLLEALRVSIDPVDAELARLAIGAWRRFGKGRHSAALNFGDCFSYALAKSLGAPLIFKGADFSLTDIGAAI